MRLAGQQGSRDVEAIDYCKEVLKAPKATSFAALANASSRHVRAIIHMQR